MDFPSKIVIAPDGSKSENSLSYGLAVHSEDGQQIATFSDHMDTNQTISHPSSTRLEMKGFSTSLKYANIIHDTLISSCGEGLSDAHIVCDSKCTLAIDKKLEIQRYRVLSGQNGDIAEEMHIYKQKAKSRFTVTSSWVQGHADKRKDPKDLTFEEKLNIQADKLATFTEAPSITTLETNDFTPAITIKYNNILINGKITSTLKHHIGLRLLFNYYMTKREHRFKRAHLTIFTKAWESFTRHLLPTLGKLIYNWNSFGDRKTLFHNKENHCPSCNNNDTKYHFLRCPNNEIQLLFTQFCIDAQPLLSKITTPEISDKYFSSL